MAKILLAPLVGLIWLIDITLVALVLWVIEGLDATLEAIENRFDPRN